MVFPALGACGIAENGLAECTYAAEESDCTADGQICVNGRCLVERPLSPGAGDVVITELLYDPQAGLRESTGEWIEIFNPTDTLFNLNACELADSASGSPLSGLFIESGEYLVFGKSDDPAENGGLDVDGLFEFNLTNSGDVISIRCGETVVDVVNYGDESFPDASAASISLSGDLLDAAINDGGAAWCAATDVYLVDPEHRGTPGTANPVCDNEAILCEPNPCNAAPAPRCDGNIQIVSSAPGVCRVEQGVQTCEYPEERVPCANDAECREGVCVPLAARPVEAGDVVISEIMYDPDGGLAENSGEWFELQNLSDDVVSLDGCVVGDNSNETNIVGLFIVPRGYAVFGRTDDRGRNGGLDPDHLFDFSLNNVGDTITVRCGDVELDTVDFSLDSFPDARQATLNLDPAHADPLDNDDGLNWCPATSVYLAVPEHRGTPGGPNDACAFENPCEPNPCNEAPAARCEVGENIAISYGAQGQCVLDGRQATCEYPSQEEDCGPGNQVCVNGACIAADARAQVGEVVFTEVMYDPHHVLGDATAEWVELYNRSARALTLDECTFWNGREDSEPMVIADLLLEPGEFVVFAASQNEAENGGLAGVHQAFGFSLSNQGTSLTLNCGGDAIDRVRYDDGNLFPDARAASISLDPDAFDGDANDHGFNWCLARDTYFADPDGNAENDNLGTPGAVNPQCPAVDLTVDYCRFQFPDEVTVTVGQDLDVYGVVYEEGITDRSPQSDADRRLRAQAGYGPRGSDPTESPGWSWYEATTNAGWNGAIRDEPDNDEYITRLRPQEPGDYDLVYRFTLDTGLTWLLCDLGEGSGNGYSANDAAHLTVTADPCIPSPCGNPPLPTCEGNELLFYGGDGVCEAVDGEAVCTYPINIREDCGQNNQECDLDANGFAECQ